MAALLLSVSAQAHVVSSITIDAASGAVLEQRHADAPQYPASLTKLMTLYLAFEALHKGRISLGERFVVSRHAASREPTKMGLHPGWHVRVRDLVLGMVTESANDAATVIAEGLAGSEKRFARRMTRKAHELGMLHTTFRNASGLPNRRQRTTARDMALLARALLRDFPDEYHYFSTRSFVFRGRTFVNHNHLLDDQLGVDGIKTGYTRASGYHLVASAERNGHRVISVLLGERSWRKRDRRMVVLLKAAFAREHAERLQAIAALQDRVSRAASAFSPITAAHAEEGVAAARALPRRKAAR